MVRGKKDYDGDSGYRSPRKWEFVGRQLHLAFNDNQQNKNAMIVQKSGNIHLIFFLLLEEN
jgi:hypothetical protein